jgi:hypothetical protein
MYVQIPNTSSSSAYYYYKYLTLWYWYIGREQPRYIVQVCTLIWKNRSIWFHLRQYQPLYQYQAGIQVLNTSTQLVCEKGQVPVQHWYLLDLRSLKLWEE